jgi:hypothetical protein
MTLSRIQDWESLGFEWSACVTAWEDRLSELADYCKIQGHCNVPQNYSENTKLAKWVDTQRSNYRLHRDGKTSPMTAFRIQELECLGFEWDSHGAAWEDRLSELADYRIFHGDCNVPRSYSDNTKLANWVSMQRNQYRLHVEGKRSHMTPLRIQALESLGFQWKASISRGKGKPKNPSLDDDVTRVRERAMEAPDHIQQHSLQKISLVEKSAAIKSKSLWNTKNPTGMAKSTSASSRVRVGTKNTKRVKAGDARLNKTDLDGSPSELAAKPSLHSDVYATKSLSPDKSAPAGDSVDVNTRKDALVQAKLPGPAHQPDFLVATKKPANSRQGAESQPETAPSNEILRVNPVAAEPSQQRHNVFTDALLLGDGSTGNGIQAISDKPANAPLDTQQTPPDEVFQSDNVLNEVEMELIWLGEESMYCSSCPDFQFQFIYEYASPALKVELRKLSRDEQSEAEKLKQIVRMDDWRVSGRFAFVRKDIRMNYF